MKRAEFIENLEFTGAYDLENNGKDYQIFVNMMVSFPDGHMHQYSSWDELFQQGADDKTLGELVDELTTFDKSVIYHVPLRAFDENGNPMF